MTREEKIAKALPLITLAGPGDIELLRMASDQFLEQIAQLADDIESRFEDSHYRQFDERISCGRLMAYADPVPGITLYLEMGDIASYKMRSIWATNVRMPETLSVGLAGRLICDVVELPDTLPIAIREAIIREVWNAGSRRAGYSTRFDLDQPVWRPNTS